MTDDFLDSCKALFARALELPPESRESFVRAEAESEAHATDVLELLAHVTPPGGRSPAHRIGSPEPPPLPPFDFQGYRVGDYLLGEIVGRGGMGVVYRARRTSDGLTVAVKLLPPLLSGSDRHVTRFRREALLAGRLDHPSIVPVLDRGEERGVEYYVMPFVEGESLGQMLARLRKSDAGPPPPRRAATIALKLARALDQAHSQGVLHRDVKPNNVLMAGPEDPKLADFGLARDLDLGPSTTVGVGTIRYLSPEQVDARDRAPDGRIDVFALGLVLYELLTLRHPLDGVADGDLFARIVRRDAKAPHRVTPACPRALSNICRKALERERDRRFTTVAEMADELERWLAGEPVRTRAPLPRAPRPVLLGGAMAAILVGLSWPFADDAPEERSAEWGASAQTERTRTLLVQDGVRRDLADLPPVGTPERSEELRRLVALTLEMLPDTDPSVSQE